MNKLLFLGLITVLVLFFTACSQEEEIIDYYPVTMTVVVSDAQGNDLLQDTAFVQSITFDYDGTTYTIPYETEFLIKTRAYAAWFQGPWLWTTIVNGQERTCVVLGEWAGDSKWDNEAVVINWPDGRHNSISFTLKKTGVNNATYYLDGAKHSSSVFEFTYE